MSGKQTDFDILMEHGIDIRSRTVYIQGDIDLEYIRKKVKQIRYLDKTPKQAINILLDSEGGDVNQGFKLYDVIRMCSNDVNILVAGVAMSMGSVILQAGDTRSMTKNSRIMIHRGSMEVDGHFTDVQRAVAENKEMDDKCVDIYLKKIKEVKPKFRKAQVEKMMEFDTYISAEKALELGLIDDISADE